MTKLRQTIARRLKEAQNTAAMLTTFNEVDMSAILKLREQFKDGFEKKHGVKLGFMSIFVKAAIDAQVKRRKLRAPGTLTGTEQPVNIQNVPHADAAPTAGARGEFDQVAAALLDETPEAARPSVEAMLAKIRRSGSMQSLDIPLTVASLGDLVRVVSRHTLHRSR